MKRVKSITLLAIISMVIVPWGLFEICIAHPTGHDHHYGPGEMSQCEKMAAYDGEAYWPPMACVDFNLDVDEFQKTQQPFTYQIQVKHLAIVEEVALLPSIRQTYHPEIRPPPIFGHNQSILDTRPLRGPPIC